MLRFFDDRYTKPKGDSFILEYDGAESFFRGSIYSNDLMDSQEYENVKNLEQQINAYFNSVAKKLSISLSNKPLNLNVQIKYEGHLVYENVLTLNKANCQEKIHSVKEEFDDICKRVAKLDLGQIGSCNML